MNSVGVVVEYNPFHNGHAFHLASAKEVAGADVAIAVMSGNFLQRGEPALVSKWTRTEMALKAGVDIVFELPYAFAVQQADTFARGAVSILDAAGCTSLCFGSESGNIDDFLHTLVFLQEHKPRYQERLKLHLTNGNSYPKASSLAFLDLSPNRELVDLSMPNNILGYQYVKAAKELKSKMELYTITRKNAGYHDKYFTSESIASATSIRKALFSDNGSVNSIKDYMPQTTFDGLLKYKDTYGNFHRWENYWPFLKFRLLQTAPDELKMIYEMEEGLENRFLSAANQSDSFEEFMNRVKTKRYTWTRLQRACAHILTNTTKDEMYTNQEEASYLRLLGMTEKGREYLSQNKNCLGLPLLSRTAGNSFPQLLQDIRASRIYALGLKDKGQKDLLKMEFTQPPIMLKTSELK